MLDEFLKPFRNGGNKPKPAYRRLSHGERMLAENLSKTIQVKIYERIGGHDVLVYKRNVSYRREAIKWQDAIYVMNKDKVIYEKSTLAGKLRPVLLFRYNEPAPMGHPMPSVEPMNPEESPLKIDARKVALVANKYAWKNLYPNSEAMLQLIAMVAVVGLLVSVGLNAYLLADPEASENLRNIATSQARQEQQGQDRQNSNDNNNTVRK